MQGLLRAAGFQPAFENVDRNLHGRRKTADGASI
jgi:hypothetical protein